MNKQKNQLLVLIGLVIIGFMYTYVQFLFTPQWAELDELSARIVEREAYLQRLQDNYPRLSALKADVEEMRVRESQLRDEIPEEFDYPDMMMTIYSLAKANDVNPISLSYESLKQDGQTVTMGMTFSCTGARDNLHTLVEQFLKGNDYIFALDSISYSDSEDGVSANMKLTAYALQL